MKSPSKISRKNGERTKVSLPDNALRKASDIFYDWDKIIQPCKDIIIGLGLIDIVANNKDDIYVVIKMERTTNEVTK